MLGRKTTPDIEINYSINRSHYVVTNVEIIKVLINLIKSKVFYFLVKNQPEEDKNNRSVTLYFIPS